MGNDEKNSKGIARPSTRGFKKLTPRSGCNSCKKKQAIREKVDRLKKLKIL